MNTRDKRASAIGLGLASLLVLPQPGAIDQPDRQHVAYSYRGIEAAEAQVVAPADVDVTGTYDPDVTLTGTFDQDADVTGTFDPDVSLTGAVDMPVEGSLTLYVGADMTVTYRDESATPPNMAAWTILLDIRKKDTSADPALLSKTGVVSGVYNADPDTNLQVCTFTLSDDDLAATVFKGDDWTGRYSIKRTTASAEMPLRFGDATIVRVTQA